MKMKILILDTETTGTSTNDEIIELSYMEISDNISEALSISYDENSIEELKSKCVTTHWLPNVAVNPAATKVHGKTFRDLLKYPSVNKLVVPKADMYIGHNIQFDHRMLKKPKVKLLCTLKLARRLITKTSVTDYKLDTLINKAYPESKLNLNPHHSAELDVLKVLFLLKALRTQFANIDTFSNLQSLLAS